jgi:hypothetical protein
LPALAAVTWETEREAAPASETISLPTTIETAHYSAKIDPKAGALSSLKLKPSGRAMLAGPVLLAPNGVRAIGRAVWEPTGQNTVWC